MREWDEKSSTCSQSRSSFCREARLTPSSIFGRAAQDSQWFRRTARTPRSRCSPPGNSLEINPIDGPPVLLKDVSPDHHHWVELKLVGEPKSPRDAVGATVY